MIANIPPFDIVSPRRAFVVLLLVFSICGFQGAPAQASGLFRPDSLRDGLVGYWRLDEASGERLDQSGHDNHLVDHNLVRSIVDDFWSTGERALKMDYCCDQYLSVAHTAQTDLDLSGVNAKLTMAAWIKLTEFTPYRQIIMQKEDSVNRTGYGFGLNDSRNLFLNLNFLTSFESRGLPVSDGRWHHVAVTFDPQRREAVFFIDGNVVTAHTSVTGAIGANTEPFFLGRFVRDGQPVMFNGLIKDAAVWNTDLTPIQIKSLAFGVDLLSSSAIRPGNIPDGLISWWKLDEISDSSEPVQRRDSQPAGNHLLDADGALTGGGYIDGAGARLEGRHVLYVPEDSQRGLELGSLEAAVTIAGWIKPREMKSFAVGLWGKWPSYDASIEADGAVKFIVGDTTLATKPATISPETWHHIATVYEVVSGQNAMRIFIDGIQQTNGPATSTGARGGRFQLGVNRGGQPGASYFEGALSDVAFWGRALSSEEIIQLATGLPVQSAGVVSYWKLDELSGKSRADSVGANHLAESNRVEGVAGQVGNAASFRRVDNSGLVLPSEAQAGLAFSGEPHSLLAWIKPALLDDYQKILSRYNHDGSLGYFFEVNRGNRLELAHDNLSSLGGRLLSLGDWHHAAVSWTPASSSNVVFWLNGVPSARESFSTVPSATAAPFMIGRAPAGHILEGEVDEVIVARREFRDEEIKALYIRGRHGLEALPPLTPTGHSFNLLGDAFFDSSVRRLGTQSLRLDGNGDYLQLADHSAWAFGSTPFTLELWVRFDELPPTGSNVSLYYQMQDPDNLVMLQLATKADVGLVFGVKSGGEFPVYLRQGAYEGWEVDIWYHLAVVRSEQSWTLFRDGRPLAQATSNPTPVADLAAPVFVGYTPYPGSEAYLKGWVDELRISRIARWNSSFALPSEEYTRDPESELLLHFNAQELTCRCQPPGESSLDVDRDGLPDEWELVHGLNPRFNDASDDLDLDGLSNIAEYTYGLSNSFKPNPSLAFTGGGTIGDLELVTGKRENRFHYDRNDRLIGAHYANGLLIAYVYDGNSNLRRQFYASLQTQTNRLPLFWRAKFGLDGTSAGKADGPWDDPDGDGWSNYQEWKADSAPTDGTSVPEQNVVQNAPETEILAEPATGGAISRVRIRVFDPEGNKVLPTLEYRTNLASAAWNPAFIAEVEPGLVYSSALRVEALPTGSEHTLVWNALRNFPGGFSGKVHLRAQSQDMTSTGEPSATAEYQLDIEPPPPLTLTLTKPAHGAVFVEPAAIALEASASGEDDRVMKVEFFELVIGKVGEDSNAPFSVLWEDVPVGAHRLFAEAIDELGVRVRSANTVSIVVDPGAPELTVTVIQDSVMILWSALAAGYVLQETDSLSPPISWSNLTATPVSMDNQKGVQLPKAPTTKFYRLMRQ